jgi:eukaryotic-like serine/threonine-protein kinase
VADSRALDEVIDSFLEGRIDFARFCKLVEAQLVSRPGVAHLALARMDLLQESGQLPPGLYSLVGRVLQRSTRGDVTAPIEERPAEGGDADPPALSDDAADPAARKIPPRLVHTPAEAPRPAATPGVGSVLAGRYRLEGLLERGGMGLVYRAADLRGGQHGLGPAHVGVKLANPDFEGRGAACALEREASLLAELSHPGVVRMLAFEPDGGNAFMVMELLAGERLASRLLRSEAGGLPVDEAMVVIRELAEILAYVHRRGVVHRDVKPANVFLTSSSGLRLLDFGLAARIGVPDGDGEGAPRAGTPLYASPEMLAGEPPDPREDVYSLACVAYELLAGDPPGAARPDGGPTRGKRKLARPPGLTNAQWKALQAALSLEPADRPQDATGFLESFFPPAPRRRILPWMAAALVGGAIIGLGLAWIGPWHGGPEPPASTDPTPAPSLEPAAGSATEPAPASESQPVAEQAPAPESMSETEPESAPAPADPAPMPEAQPTPAPPRVETPPPVSAPAPQRPVALALAASQFRISESGGAVRLELRRPARYQGPLRVLWRTVDQTARDGRDFIGSSGWRLAEAPADAASLVIFIPIVDDSIAGPDVTFLVEIREAPQGPPLGTPARAEVTIVDDD